MAAGRSRPARRFNALRGSHCAGETDPAVRSEWLEEAA
jgi:hypothetical protein